MLEVPADAAAKVRGWPAQGAGLEAGGGAPAGSWGCMSWAGTVSALPPGSQVPAAAPCLPCRARLPAVTRLLQSALAPRPPQVREAARPFIEWLEQDTESESEDEDEE